ncbi:hypothetical protein VRK_14080 [Vibrio sp. MEBiC08052]|nr:hypothetical protein VRK_14080 [Vibrio sp. MEBiC08052]
MTEDMTLLFFMVEIDINDAGYSKTGQGLFGTVQCNPCC